MNLQFVSSLLRIEGENASESAAMQRMQRRIQAVAFAHDQSRSLQSSGLVPLEVYLRQVAIAATRTRPPGPVRLQTELAPSLVPIDVAISCGLIVHEIVAGAAACALHAGEGASMKVSLTRVGPSLFLRFTTIGMGPGSAPQEHAAGSQRLVSLMVSQIGGEVKTAASPAPDWGVVFADQGSRRARTTERP
jgi:two-component sensor histidine kinase